MEALGHPPTLPNLVRAAADRFGDRRYLATPTRSITFAELESRSRLLARRLLAAGIGKGTPVGMLFPQGPDFMVAFTAIARAGAIAVPLSTFLKPGELRSAVRHADLAALLAARPLLDAGWPELAAGPGEQLRLPAAPYLRRVWLDPCDAIDVEPDVDDALLAEVEAEVRPSDRLLMIHTSGATAEPKAVLHTHGAQVRHSWTLAQLYELTPEARTFTTMPFFWVGGLTVSLLTHLHVGGEVLTVERLDGPTIVDFLEAERPTRLAGWSLVERLRSDPALEGRDLSWIEALQPPGTTRPGLRHGSLGMTETSGPHTAAAASANLEDLPEHQRGSFGPPVPGVEHRIVEPGTTDELPDGAEGEICVRGDSLMDGMHKRERADVFDADGWYHTGDKGFFRDGLLFFTGRLTEMIKTGGANVAPREVELAVQRLDGVQAAFVVGVPDGTRGEIVGCIVCPEPGAALDVATVESSLREELSSFKVPRRFAVVPYDEIPFLPSGKVSKARLLDLLGAQGGTA